MLKISKILCPTDFSDFSMQAIEVAGDLAQTFSAKLYLVNVVSPVPILETPTNVGFDPNRYQSELKTHAESRIQKIKQKAVDNKVSVETVVTVGSEVDEILNVVKTNKIDLMVLATHGRSGLQRLFFGSVAEKIIRHATVPVLTIRPQTQA